MKYNIQKNLWPLILTKILRPLKIEYIICSTSGAVEIIIHTYTQTCPNTKQFLLQPLQKLTGIIQIRARKPEKLLEANIEKNLCVLELGKNFFNRTLT